MLDVRGRGVVFGVAPNVDGVRRLVDANVVDLQVYGERQVIEIDWPEVVRHSQVGNEVLSRRISELARVSMFQTKAKTQVNGIDVKTHHRLAWNGALLDLHQLVWAHARAIQGPRDLVVRNPGDVLRSRYVNALSSHKPR